MKRSGSFLSQFTKSQEYCMLWSHGVESEVRFIEALCHFGVKTSFKERQV